MKREFLKPDMEIKRFSKESVITLSGEIKMTNKDSVTNALNEEIKGKSATVSEYNLSWN